MPSSGRGSRLSIFTGQGPTHADERAMIGACHSLAPMRVVGGHGSVCRGDGPMCNPTRCDGVYGVVESPPQEQCHAMQRRALLCVAAASMAAAAGTSRHFSAPLNAAMRLVARGTHVPLLAPT